MSGSDVDVLAKDTLFQGYFQIDRYRLRHRTHAGGMTGVMEREIFERGHAVGVLPYDPIRDEVVMIEQFRTGALAAGLHPWLLEIVAGIIEEGENLEDVARREVQEEIGLQVIGEMLPILRYLVSPGGSSETIAVYCARVDSSKAGGIHGLVEEHEDIRVFTMPALEAVKLPFNDPRARNSTTIVALQWLAANRDNVRRMWAG